MNKLKSIFNSPYGLFETQRRKGRAFFWLHVIYLGISHFPTGGQVPLGKSATEGPRI